MIVVLRGSLRYIKRAEIEGLKTYVLEIKIDRDIKISVGKLGELNFKKGYYLYVGSARKGLEARIKRHLRKDKSNFWHVDYLLSQDFVGIKRIWIVKKDECQLAKIFYKQGYNFIKKFGSSDCNCLSHLFFLDKHRFSKTYKQLLYKDDTLMDFRSSNFD
jgi:Uri superfamily endonuclease